MSDYIEPKKSRSAPRADAISQDDFDAQIQAILDKHAPRNQPPPPPPAPPSAPPPFLFGGTVSNQLQPNRSVAESTISRPTPRQGTTLEQLKSQGTAALTPRSLTPPQENPVENAKSLLAPIAEQGKRATENAVGGRTPQAALGYGMEGFGIASLPFTAIDQSIRNTGPVGNAVADAAAVPFNALSDLGKAGLHGIQQVFPSLRTSNPQDQELYDNAAGATAQVLAGHLAIGSPFGADLPPEGAPIMPPPEVVPPVAPPMPPPPQFTGGAALPLDQIMADKNAAWQSKWPQTVSNEMATPPPPAQVPITEAEHNAAIDKIIAKHAQLTPERLAEIRFGNARAQGVNAPSNEEFAAGYNSRLDALKNASAGEKTTPTGDVVQQPHGASPVPPATPVASQGEAPKLLSEPPTVSAEAPGMVQPPNTQEPNVISTSPPSSGTGLSTTTETGERGGLEDRVRAVVGRATSLKKTGTYKTQLDQEFGADAVDEAAKRGLVVGDYSKQFTPSKNSYTTTVKGKQFLQSQGTSNATQQEQIQSGDQPEHQNGNVGGTTAEAGGRNSDVGSGEEQTQTQAPNSESVDATAYKAGEAIEKGADVVLADGRKAIVKSIGKKGATVTLRNGESAKVTVDQLTRTDKKLASDQGSLLDAATIEGETKSQRNAKRDAEIAPIQEKIDAIWNQRKDPEGRLFAADHEERIAPLKKQIADIYQKYESGSAATAAANAVKSIKSLPDEGGELPNVRTEKPATPDAELSGGFGLTQGVVKFLNEKINKKPVWNDLTGAVGNFMLAKAKIRYDVSKMVDELIRSNRRKVRNTMAPFINSKGDIDLLRTQSQEIAAMAKKKRAEGESGHARKLEKFAQIFSDASNLTKSEQADALGIRDYLRVMREKGVEQDVLSTVKGDEFLPAQWKAGSFGWNKNQMAGGAFWKAKTFPTFFEGIMAGGIPRTLDVAAIISDYHSRFEGTMAKRGLIADLKKAKAADGKPLAAPGESAIEKMYPNDKESQQKAKEKIKGYKKWTWGAAGDIVLHPDVAAQLNRMFTPSMIRENKTGRIVLRVVSEAKAGKMGWGGVFHPVMIGFHQGAHTALTRGLWDMLHGKTPEVPLVQNVLKSLFKPDELNPHDPKIAAKIRYGLPIVTDERQLQLMMEGTGAQHGLIPRALDWLPKKIGEKVSGKEFENGPAMALTKYTFTRAVQHMMNAMYDVKDAENMRHYSKDIASGKISEDAIHALSAREAAAQAGAPMDEFEGKSKTIRDIESVFWLAPSLLKSTVRTTTQALNLKWGRAQQMAIVKTAMAGYIAARILNKLDHGDYEWGAENAFYLVHNGVKYGMRNYPNDAMEAFVIPILDMMAPGRHGKGSREMGQWWEARSGLVPQTLIEFFMGENYMDKPRTVIPEQAFDFGMRFAPILFQNAFPKAFAGDPRTTLPEAGIKAIGGTVRRHNSQNNVRTTGARTYDPVLDR